MKKVQWEKQVNCYFNVRLNFIVKFYVVVRKLDNIKVFNDFLYPLWVMYDL